MLFKSNIIVPDQNIACIIAKRKYKKLNYPINFYPEFKTLFNPKTKEEIQEQCFDIFKDKNYIDNNKEYFENMHH